jgi:hypothetical protein
MLQAEKHALSRVQETAKDYAHVSPVIFHPQFFLEVRKEGFAVCFVQLWVQVAEAVLYFFWFFVSLKWVNFYNSEHEYELTTWSKKEGSNVPWNMSVWLCVWFTMMYSSGFLRVLAPNWMWKFHRFIRRVINRATMTNFREVFDEWFLVSDL